MGKNSYVKNKSFFILTCVLYVFRIVSTKLSNKCECLQLLISISPMVLAIPKKQGVDFASSFDTMAMCFVKHKN